MQVRTTLIAVVALFAAVAANAAAAAPQEVVKLPRVVVTGKAVQQVVMLPRVVVVGVSTETLQRQLLASKAARSSTNNG